jgi:peptidoglycan-N-acetylglucosamine deacetylase
LNKFNFIYRAFSIALFFTSCSGNETTGPSISQVADFSSSQPLSSFHQKGKPSSSYRPKSSITNSSSSALSSSFFKLTPLSSSISTKGSVRFTFDDNYIDSWYEVRDSLLKYDIQATFFISGFQKLSNEKVIKLIELENLGFEIGFHSVNHIDATVFLEDHSTDEYFNQEIKPDLDSMRAAGFSINSFAYPFGKGTPLLDSLLLKEFKHIRYVAESQRNGPIKNLGMFDEGFSIRDLASISSAIGIDSNYQTPLALISQALQKAKNDNEILTLYAHKIVLESPKSYQVKLSTLISIAKEAKRLELKSITFSQQD